ncbi:MAG: adenylate/guanylate cyclase domain-containing protein, partial [Pseudomonadota bacterium]
KGSTQLYEDVGDAAAYRLVREFFAEIAAAARAHEGAVIKTIGDAVNLSFVRPAMALRCARAIHIAFAAHNAALPDDTPRTECKTGIHVGRTIAVTLNRQLDYYGTAVNLAARLCDYADPGEIVISDAMCAAPDVADMLAGAAATTERATLKGFAAPVEVRRITDVAGLSAALPPTAPDQST